MILSKLEGEQIKTMCFFDGLLYKAVCSLGWKIGLDVFFCAPFIYFTSWSYPEFGFRFVCRPRGNRKIRADVVSTRGLFLGKGLSVYIVFYRGWCRWVCRFLRRWNMSVCSLLRLWASPSVMWSHELLSEFLIKERWGVYKGVLVTLAAPMLVCSTRKMRCKRSYQYDA